MQMQEAAAAEARRRRRLDAWRRREARGSYAVVAFRLRLICAPSTGHRRGTESLQRSEGRVRLEHIHMRDPPLLFLLFLLVCYLLYNGHARRRRRRHGRGSYNLNFFRASSRPTGHGPGRQSCMPQPYIYACLSIMPKSNRSQLMSRLEKSEESDAGLVRFRTSPTLRVDPGQADGLGRFPVLQGLLTRTSRKSWQQFQVRGRRACICMYAAR